MALPFPVVVVPAVPVTLPLALRLGESTLIGVSAFPGSDSFLSGSRSSGGRGGGSR